MQIQNYDEIMLEFEEKLEKRIERLNYEYSIIRAGRANPKMLDKITVDYYGTQTPLHQMANINVPEARTMTISPWDMSQVKEVVKALLASDLGVTPSDDGRMIRLNFPALTEERRKEIVKDVRKYCEDAKRGIRNDRRDVLEAFKKLDKEIKISEDDMKAAEAEVQKAVDKFNAKADAVSAAKEKDILSV